MDIDPYFDWQHSAWNDILAGAQSSSNHQSRTFSLPEEILEHIIRQVADSSPPEQEPNSPEFRVRNHTLFNLSLVSKTMNRITESFLYRTYCTFFHPEVFLLALYARPHRIHYVRELSIAPISSLLYSPNHVDMDANLQMLGTDRTISVLLRACTTLEVLDITICEEYQGSRTQRFVQELASEDYYGPLRRTLKRVVFRTCSSTCRTVPDVYLLDHFPYVEKKVFYGLDQ